jgi:NDP-sugar pyrophosphorylase family protein
MVPILGKPLLEWRLETLPTEITEVIITTGYLGEQITEYFGVEWQGRKMTYVAQEELNGTGGSMKLLEPYITSPVLVTMGDDLYVAKDLQAILPHRFAMLGKHTKEAEKFGLLTTNEDDTLQKVTERPHGHQEGLINTGAYMVDRSFFAYPLVAISATEYGLPQTLASMVPDETILVRMATDWQPVGCPEDIPLAEEFIKKYFL